MGRPKFLPTDFGISMDRAEFDDRLAQDFDHEYGGGWTIDELLLHPREAMRFCDEVRRQHKWWDLPDDIILRVILGRRKNP